MMHFSKQIVSRAMVQYDIYFLYALSLQLSLIFYIKKD